jgi:hypothetical protein
MRVGARRFVRLSVSFGAAGILVVLTSACTGRGGGTLPPVGGVFAAPASFGFQFSCERSSNSTNPNTPRGRLRLELSYTDHGVSPMIGAGFSIHGTVDTLDPVLESAICIGQNPPPGGNELIFLGRYRPTSSVPAGFAKSCPTSESPTTPLCRFEVIVRDNDRSFAPSANDYFSIKLSSSAPADSELPQVGSQLEPTTVFYTRGGLLQGGNLTVD